MNKKQTVKPSLIIRISTVFAVLLLIFATGGAAFVCGYWLAFSKFANVYAETSVLKAKAAELEAELLHLRNYAVLIDAMAVGGKASTKLELLPPLNEKTKEK